MLFILITTCSFSQKKNIEFKVEKKDKALIINGVNNTKKPLVVTLTIKDIKGLNGYNGPIVKTVPANSNILFTQLTHELDVYEYKLSYTYKNVETEAEKIIKNTNKEDFYLKDISKINEGIVIFDDEGCGRCDLVTNYLIGNKIDFKIINIANNEENTKLMWKTIKEKGASLQVKAPVIIVDGKLSHSHLDLKKFLETLK